MSWKSFRSTIFFKIQSLLQLWELAMLMVRVRQSGDFMGEAECTPLMEVSTVVNCTPTID